MFSRCDPLVETSDVNDSWSPVRDEITKKLIENDHVYRALAEEKILGWKSEALNLLWSSRKRSFKSKSSQTKADSSKRFTPEEKKYFLFYNDVLGSVGPDVFRRGDKIFADIGCAPGGMSKYLTSMLQWRGHGFSLSPEEGGLEMRYSNPVSLEFAFANMSREGEWRKVIDCLKAIKFTKLDFINLGVVVDVGQVEADSGSGAELTVRATNACRNQLIVMLRTLKEGGNCMWIHSISHVDTFFFFLDYLVDCYSKITVFNTLVPSRSPVYVLLEGFKPTHPRAKALDHYLVNTPIRYEHPEEWQVKDWSVVERVMKNEYVRESIHQVWNDKREKLWATRTAAEERFAKCSGNADEFVNHHVQALMPALSGVRTKTQTTTAPTAAPVIERQTNYICGLTPSEEKTVRNIAELFALAS